MLIALAGAGVLIYPHADAWLTDIRHTDVITGYAQQQHARTSQQTTDELDAARAYNSAIPAGPLHDPFATGSADTTANADYAQYSRTLDLGPNGLMGVISIPKIDVNLPIYHGTSATVLDAGVGHLYGTALPVGGAGTHAVLTGHSGVVGDTLFTNLDKLGIGDTFTITVLNQKLTYQVDQVLTVLPEQTKALAAVPGQDYVTLVTCTPIGINSHRLLVRGHRIDTPGDAATGVQALLADVGPGFPWWALAALGAVVAGILVTAPLARRAPAKGAR